LISLDSDAEVSAAESVELKPGKPKWPLINCLPKKPRERQVNIVAFDLEDDSDDNSTINDSDADTDDLTEEYYRWQLEKEHNQVFNIRESDYSFHPTFLAMVTAKIQGTIMGQPSTMLIDNGSELNMMVQSTQVKLKLPMDPSGKDWVLRGVSGHQVNLVGLCHNIPIHVGGVPFPHNFFITSDNISQKDIILGQPWLFSYSMRIKYAHAEGMNLQVWQDGDHQGCSVQITLPIMSAPRNVFPIQIAKCHTTTVNTVKIITPDHVPEFPSSIISTITVPEFDLKRLGPSVKASEILVYAMESQVI
jgi:Retroviral aspartyl protease